MCTAKQVAFQEMGEEKYNYTMSNKITHPVCKKKSPSLWKKSSVHGKEKERKIPNAVKWEQKMQNRLFTNDTIHFLWAWVYGLGFC